MKAINEFLVTRKQRLIKNRFGYTKKDLSGIRISSDDIKPGMYIKMYVQDCHNRVIYAIAREKIPVLSGNKRTRCEKIWTYAYIDLVGECWESFNAAASGSKDCIGSDNRGNSIYIMTPNDYMYFTETMKQNNIDIPEDFKIDI